MIYVASSWRNDLHQTVVDSLRRAGLKAYDFKRDEGANFHWTEVEEIAPGVKWQDWDFQQYMKALEHPRAIAGYRSDMGALTRCTLCVLVLPAGASAHIEAGWATGAGRPLVIYRPDGYPHTADLMYKMASRITDALPELISICRDYFPLNERG